MSVGRGVFLDYATVDNGDLDRQALAGTLEHWRWFDNVSPDALDEALDGVRVAVSNKVPLGEAEFAAHPRLGLVALAATGTDKIDLEAARRHGVTVCNSRDYATESVAQHAITLALNLLTGQPFYMRRVAAGAWTDTAFFSMHDRPIREARGLNFGVVGYGVLGRATADKARALGMHVLVAERPGRAPREGRLPFDEVVSRADVLSFHCPLNDETRGMVRRELLAAMKPDAVLVNTSRGGIVDEPALATALRGGVIAGAALDVLSKEPPPADHPLLQGDVPNLLVTPHNAWASRSARQAVLDQLAEIIAAWCNGEPINTV